MHLAPLSFVRSSCYSPPVFIIVMILIFFFFSFDLVYVYTSGERERERDLVNLIELALALAVALVVGSLLYMMTNELKTKIIDWIWYMYERTRKS